MTQDGLDKAYASYQDLQCICVSHSLKDFMDMDAYISLKQQKSTQDGQAVYFNVYNWFLGPNHEAMQDAEAEKKLQNSHYDGKKKRWHWDMYVTLNQKCHTIMESHADLPWHHQWH